MNLHGIASGMVGTVNPHRPLTIQVSVGEVEDSSGKITPKYATPGAFVGSISANQLTVVSQSLGVLQAGQLLTSAGLLDNTRIVSQLSGAPGGVGIYILSNQQVVSPAQAFTTSLVVPGQIQPVGWRDIQMMEGLNLQGTRKKIYLYGRFDGLIRVDNKGGDLITDYAGNKYLVAMVAEQWDDRVWCSVFATLQDGD